MRKTHVKGSKKMSAPTYIGIAALIIIFAIVATLWITSREVAPPDAPLPTMAP